MERFVCWLRSCAYDCTFLRGAVESSALSACYTLLSRDRILSKGLDALDWIKSELQLKKPLPFEEWSITHDVVLLIKHILKERPELMVECGLGASIVIAAYCFKQIGKGEVIALEHEKEWIEKNEPMLQEYGVWDFSDVFFAPLIKQSIKGDQYLWYDPTFLSSIKRIDLLFVDGPPAHIQKLSRYQLCPFYLNTLPMKE